MLALAPNPTVGKCQRERNRNDGIDFDLTFFEVVSLADTNVRTHPDANASRDRTTSHAIAQVFREKHRASLARCFRLQRGLCCRLAA
jgi:hypothetical protein